MVNGILDMSKMETGDFEISPEPFAADTVIGNCCDLLALKARECGLDLVTRIDADLPEIVADKRAFKQILLNLLSNAVKFTDRGGRVTVTAGVDATVLRVAVEDTGVGISADDLPKVGKPFFQARTAYDRRHDGTGLGLSIVKGLVMLHGGHVDIASRLGEGSKRHGPAAARLRSGAAEPAGQGGAPVVRTAGGRRRSSSGKSRNVRERVLRAGDDDFDAGDYADERRPSRFAKRRCGCCAVRCDSLAGLIAAGGMVMILINALFLQSGPHPAPIFANKPAPARRRQQLAHRGRPALPRLRRPIWSRSRCHQRGRAPR